MGQQHPDEGEQKCNLEGRLTARKRIVAAATLALLMTVPAAPFAQDPRAKTQDPRAKTRARGLASGEQGCRKRRR